MPNFSLVRSNVSAIRSIRNPLYLNFFIIQIGNMAHKLLESIRNTGGAMKDIYKSGLILLSAVGAFFIGMKLPKAIVKFKENRAIGDICSTKKQFEPSKINFC